jgi:hypothetical protein
VAVQGPQSSKEHAARTAQCTCWNPCRVSAIALPPGACDPKPHSLQRRLPRGNWGFWTFIAGNVLWIVRGWHEDAIALIVLQVGLFVLNLRGAKKNDPATA